jgi:glutaminase
MTHCGMYEASAEFAKNIGLPSKSSVSGALLSIMPNKAAIACYSPALDAIGNSVAGLFLLRQLKIWLDYSPAKK